MKRIYLTLGSNYTFGFAIKNLFGVGTNKDVAELKASLKKRCKGEVLLYNRGRESMVEALRPLAGKKVGLCGFSCYAVTQAIEAAGANPVYMDILPSTLHFGLAELKKQHQKQNLGAVIVQNTLGNPVDIKAIEVYCKQQKIVLIEDAAHGFGGEYPDGRKVGTVGDYSVLAFGRDKLIDVVNAGILIDRTSVIHLSPSKTAKIIDRFRDRVYPLLTVTVRKTSGKLPIGQALHKLLNATGLLQRSADKPITGLHKLMPYKAKLLLGLLDNYPETVAHRRQLQVIYARGLKGLKNTKVVALRGSVPIRFGLLVKNRASILKNLKAHNIMINPDDSWYETPVWPARTMIKSAYKKKQCPVAEQAGKLVLNLPTDINTTAADAELIVSIVKESL